jgi:hypothetical protein
MPVHFLTFSDALIRFLQWDGFIVTTKLCYAFYLVQIPIFQLLIANRRDIRFYSGSSVVSMHACMCMCEEVRNYASS